MASHWPEFAAVVLSAIVYLIVDAYPQVKSVAALLRTPSFYLLITIFVVLNLIAYGGISLAMGSKIESLVGSVSFLALVVLSTLGTVGFLQSLSIKVAGSKFVDVEKVINEYRSRVFADTSKKYADLERLRGPALADRLEALYGDNLIELRTDYFEVMRWIGRKDEDILNELKVLEEQAASRGLKFERLILQRIANADPARAKAILKYKLKNKAKEKDVGKSSGAAS